MPEVSRNGATIHYDRVGTGPAVLLLQGVGLAGAAWRPQVEGLAGGFTLVTVDNRGAGGSTMVDVATLSVEQMAADAVAVLDHAGIERAHVAGHSMGGAIATELALTAPARVRSLALLCTFRRGRDATAITPTMLWLGLRTRAGTRAMRRRAFVALVVPRAHVRAAGPDRVAAELAGVFGRDLADQPAIVMPQLRALSRYDAGERLRALGGIPTLVASAAHDHIARPASGRALAAAIPGATFVELPDAGHAVPIQCPGSVNDLLRRHWEGA